MKVTEKDIVIEVNEKDDLMLWTFSILLKDKEISSNWEPRREVWLDSTICRQY